MCHILRIVRMPGAKFARKSLGGFRKRCPGAFITVRRTSARTDQVVEDPRTQRVREAEPAEDDDEEEGDPRRWF
jgi:hypothetical protein